MEIASGTGRGHRGPVVVVGLLALACVMGGASWFCFDYAFGIGDRAWMGAVEELLLRDPETLGPALGAVALEEASGGAEVYSVEVVGGDKEAWVAGVYNTAVLRGWYPHRMNRGGISLVLAREDAALLEGSSEDPYGWLEGVRPEGGVARVPELGESPAYARFFVSGAGNGWAVLVSLGGIVAGVAGLLAVLAAARVRFPAAE